MKSRVETTCLATKPDVQYMGIIKVNAIALYVKLHTLVAHSVFSIGWWRTLNIHFNMGCIYSSLRNFKREGLDAPVEKCQLTTGQSSQLETSAH